MMFRKTQEACTKEELTMKAHNGEVLSLIKVLHRRSSSIKMKQMLEESRHRCL